jgi:hypothetical protein
MYYVEDEEAVDATGETTEKAKRMKNNQSSKVSSSSKRYQLIYCWLQHHRLQMSSNLQCHQSQK